MTTMEERDQAQDVKLNLTDGEEFRIATEIWQNDFVENRIPAVFQAETKWQPDDFELINGVLETWFG